MGIDKFRKVITSLLPLSLRTHSAVPWASFDTESILVNVLDSRLRINDTGPWLVRAFEYEFLHQFGVVHPHYEERGCLRLALFDVDKEGPVKIETS